MGTSWRQLGAILGHFGPSWGHLGTILGLLGHLGRSWVQLGASFFACLRNTMPANTNKPRDAKVPRLPPKKRAREGLGAILGSIFGPFWDPFWGPKIALFL